MAILRTTPLSGMALRQLGIAANLHRKDSGLRLIELAERVSRRDLPSERLLIEASARRGDTAAALRHYDHMLSVYPETKAELFPLLAGELTEPDVRQALIAHAAKPWLRDFVVNAADYDVAPESLMAFYAELTGKVPVRDMQDGTVKMLRWMQGNGQGEALAAFAARIPGLPAQTLTELGFSAMTTDERFAPLSWSLRNDGAIEAVADGNRLTLRIAPENAELAATRLTMLAAGQYAVSQNLAYEANAPRARLAWQVACQGGAAAPIWQQELPVDRPSAALVAVFAVPPGCPVQAWQLQASAEVSQFASTARIAGLALRRQ